MQDDDKPVLSFLTSHWLSMTGALLATVAGFTWLLAFPSLVRGHGTNPYIGILLFVGVPSVLVLGLILIPIGIWLSRRGVRNGLTPVPTRKSSLKRLAIFLSVATVLNIVIVSQLSYGAIEHMEGVAFCGTSCHVMKPEFTAYQVSSHAKVLCVECHVVPGAIGLLQSKMAGTRQLKEVVLNSYSRPIKPAMETNRLVPAAETCEKCHSAYQFTGARVKVIPEYAADETNSPTKTILTMMVGGGDGRGIHGAHFGPGISMRYAATDSTRETIPWVEYRNTNTKATRTYVAEGVTPGDAGKLKQYEMQCVDCHNRPAHTFQSVERGVNRAMALGRIPVSLPFIKKKAVEVLQAEYRSSEEAAQKIPAAIRDYYAASYPSLVPARSADIELAGTSLLTLYNENVFPDLKVTWGTYRNNLGHTDFPGCFRCHDAAHNTADQKTITQDCSTCHEMVATSEASPEVLKTLGLEERISSLQKK